MSQLDLSQFDGHTDGPWSFFENPKYGHMSIYAPTKNGGMIT